MRDMSNFLGIKKAISYAGFKGMTAGEGPKLL